jgi:glucose-1-phosphate adenylyltransferase
MHAVTMRANASTLASGAVPAKIGAISGVVEASFFFFQIRIARQLSRRSPPSGRRDRLELVRAFLTDCDVCDRLPLAGSRQAVRGKAVFTARKARASAKVARTTKAVATETTTTTTTAGKVVDDSTDNVLAIILGGGAGTRLYPLTKKRAKPAVPLGANYRLIDIPVSNCINSDINKMYCLTQFNSASLNRHLSQAYNSNVGSGLRQGFVEVLAAQQSPKSKVWFQGTADAVRQYMWLFNESKCEEYIILSGDHLYRMDYKPFILEHRKTGADITVSAVPMDAARAEAFGLMKIDDTGRIIDFAEKPKGKELEAMAVDTTILGLDKKLAKEMPYIASMGIYVFKASAMDELLTEKFPDCHDFGGEIIPKANELGKHVQAFLYDGYWEDIGTIEAFYNANLQCNDPDAPKFSFYESGSPIYTQSRFLPPSKLLDVQVSRSTIGDGCFIKKSTISNSMIGLRTSISEGCVIEDSMIMGADYYEETHECEDLPDCTPIGIGAGTVIRRAIVDKNARIGMDCQLINKDNVQEANEEEKGYIIKDGIIVIVKDSYIPNGTII